MKQFKSLVLSFCAAWRKALRRVLNLPHNSHSYQSLLPFISNTLPIMNELCKRSAHFIMSCLRSPFPLIQSISRYCVCFAKYNSPLGSNALFCCSRYEWPFESFILQLVNLSYTVFKNCYEDRLFDSELNIAISLIEVVLVREGRLTLPSDCNLSTT